jgi:UMF1 family MFS transporter
MKLTKEERSWALYDWANSAYSIAVTTAFFPVFFNSVAVQGHMSGAESTAALGYANSVYAIIMALLAPVLGTISDYKGFKKKFFAAFFVIGVIGTAAFVTVEEGAWGYALLLYVISAVGLSGSVVFNDALLTDVTTAPRMDRLSSFAWAIGYLGGIIPFILAFLLIASKAAALSAGLRFAFVLTAVWWFIFTLPLLKNVRQHYGIEREKGVIGKSFRRLFQTFKEIGRYKKIFLFLAGYFFYIDGVGTIFKVASDFALKAGIGSTDLLVILLITQLIAFPFTLLFGYLSKKFRLRTLITAAVGVYMAATLLALYTSLLPEGHRLALPLFLTMAMLVGTSQGGIQALSRSYFAQIIPRERAGEFFGLYDIFAKFAAILGPLLIAAGAGMFGGYTFGLAGLLVLFIIGLILFFKADAINQAGQ